MSKVDYSGPPHEDLAEGDYVIVDLVKHPPSLPNSSDRRFWIGKILTLDHRNQRLTIDWMDEGSPNYNSNEYESMVLEKIAEETLALYFLANI